MKSPSDVEELFSHLDADGDGAIDEEDRVAGCHTRRPLHSLNSPQKSVRSSFPSLRRWTRWLNFHFRGYGGT